MTSVVLSSGAQSADRGDLLALPFFEGPQGPTPGPAPGEGSRLAGADLASLLRRHGFRGQPGDYLPVVLSADGGERLIAAIGVGAVGGGEPGVAAAASRGEASAAGGNGAGGSPAAEGAAGRVREAAQQLAARTAGSASVTTTLAMLGPDRAASVRAAAEGFLLGAYRFGRAGTRPVEGHRPAPPGRLTLLLDAAHIADGACHDALSRGIVAAESANWVRDLVHSPAGEATPSALAEIMAAKAREHGATALVRTSRELERDGFGGVLGVGRGSRNEPCLVEIVHRGAAGRPLALAGKGITFDSGGLNLKRDPAEIAWMRSDMAGGAAAAAAVIAAARLGLEVHAVAVVPLAENMPGGGAIRPGDVLTHRGGRTCEVMDTDCEGRLVVADAIAYLAERNPAALIDVATLTDAAGLGHALWAAMGTDQALLREVLQAGEAAGEPGWQMPLRAEYRPLFASDTADLRNTARLAPDSAVLAATFLREFAGDAPWVHIDNGSTAWLEFATDLWPEGATGSPTRALIRFLERRATAHPRASAHPVDLEQGLR